MGTPSRRAVVLVDVSSCPSWPLTLPHFILSDLYSHKIAQNHVGSNMDMDMLILLDKAKENMEKEKRLLPSPVVLRDRESQMMDAYAARMAIELMESRTTDFELKLQSYAGFSKNHSTRPIENLSMVKFKDMFIHLVHKEKYALCRTVWHPCRSTAIQVFVEDPSGDVLLLTIYNFPLPLFANKQELDDIFSIGTLLAIREPYLKTSLLDATPFIRVDSPTDIIFLDSPSNLLQGIFWKFPSRAPRRPPHITALEHKLEGNKKFKGRLWLAAAIAYTKGLSLTPSHDLATALRLNRSESYLKLGYFSAALADAQLVLSDKALPQRSIDLGKALLKAGKANYFQDKFKEALAYFMQLKNFPDGIVEAETWIANTHLRIAEQNNGDYDWYEMFKSSQVFGSRLHVADYIGPIEVRNLGSRGHGRGIVATRDISPGELLLVCKPFVSAFPDEFPKNVCIHNINFKTGRVHRTCQVALMHKCIQKIYGNPCMKNLIYDLYASDPYPPSPDLYPPPQIGSEILHEPLRTSIDIDVSRVENICSMNAFSPLPLGYPGSISEVDPLADTPSALYLLPSLFNHSCCPNTCNFYIRDIMVIRATSKITEGDEIFLTYTDACSYEERTKRLEKWDISCQCRLCQDDRAEGPHACAERERLKASISDVIMMQPPHAEIKEFLETMINNIENTYLATRRSFKIHLAYAHLYLDVWLETLALSTHNSKHYYRVIAEHIKVLKAFGIPVIDDSIKGKLRKKIRRDCPVDKQKLRGILEPNMAITITLSVVVTFFRLDDEIRAERWLRAAWLIDDIAMGGGKKLFDERYKNIIIEAGPYAEMIASIKK